jgi:hypothetical protein
VGNRFLFTGREWLSDLKLYDYRAPSERAAIAKQIENEASRILAAEGNRPKNKK